jgi:Tfp pilus assembly protein PilN
MISINFASNNFRAAVRIARTLIAGCVILACITAGMIWKGISLRASAAAMQEKFKETEISDDQMRSLLAERQQLVKDLTTMSGLMDARKFSWTRFLSSTEAVVPLGVAFKKVEYNPNDRTLSIDGMAQSPEALRNLIVGFEKSVAFTGPFLKHQSLEKGIISFNVVAVYQEQKGSGAVSRK